MLVLTRKAKAGDGSVVTIGEGVEEGLIEVTVLEVSGDSVRIGITAPRGTEVHRKEVYLLRKAGAEQGKEAA